MFRPKIGLGAVGLSAVAAIASTVIAWPTAIAQSTVKITAKQAALRGVPAPATGTQTERLEADRQAALVGMARAVDGERRICDQLSAMAGVGIKSVRR